MGKILSSANISPFFIFFTAAIEAKAKAIVFFSSLTAFFSPFNAENMILEPSVNNFNSFGSKDALISGPLLFLLSVKCFSTKEAPIEIAPNDVYDAVFDYEIGPLDLHQCADAAMYLWASYNYSNGPEFYERLVFNGADGTEYNYLGYLETSGKEDNCKTFRRWLDLVWTYANTWSISEYNLTSVPIWDIQPGDIFIIGGFPGHAVSVVDVLHNEETGHKYFMLAQSFMPAQDNHILKNPETGTVWYEIKSYMTNVNTPQYTFHINDLKRWRNR